MIELAIDIARLRRLVAEAAWRMNRNDFMGMPIVLEAIVDAIEALEKKIDTLA